MRPSLKRRDAGLFLAALLLGLGGRTAWRRFAPGADAAAPSAAVPLSAPESDGKSAFGSLFSRPAAPAYAPVNVPALSAPEPETFGAKRSDSDERWSAGEGAQASLGEAGGGLAPRAAAAGAAGSGAQWQLGSSGSSSSGGGPAAFRAAGSGGAPSTPPGSPASPAMKALNHLGRRASHYSSSSVDLGGGGSGVAAPAPAVSPAGSPSAAPAPDGSVPAADSGAAAAGTVSAPATADGGAAPSLGSSSGGGDPGSVGAAPAGDAAAPAVAAPAASPADGSAGDPGAQQVADLTPTIGAPQIANGSNGVVVTPSGFFFAGKKGMGQTVQTMNLQAGDYKGVEFTSDLYVDPNGAGGWYIKDKTGRATTALKYSKTESLNPGKIPYIVIPRKFKNDYPNVKLGDYAAVTYGGKTLYAIIGDLGPPGVIGGGSISLAVGLGMDPTPKIGGASGGVTYVILAGTRDRTPPRDAETIQSEGRELFARAGIPVN
ncbi:MAG: glycoside hydrolase family 75 protein [Elusimicrobiota bacterium]